MTSASPQTYKWVCNNAALPFGGTGSVGSATGMGVNLFRGWDQMEILYKRCEVVALRYTLNGVNVGLIEAMQLGMVVSAGSAVGDTTCGRLNELPYSRILELPLAQAIPAKTVLQFNVQDVYGQGRSSAINEGFSSRTTDIGNPPRELWISIIGNAYDGSGTCSIRFDLTVEAIIEFYDPITLGASTEPVPP